MAKKEPEKQVAESSATPPEEKSEEKKEEEIKEPEQKTKEGFTGKFPQFKAETLEVYNKLVENAYTASSTEAQRLKKESDAKGQELDVIAKIIQSDPDLRQKMAEKLYGQDYKEDIFDDEGKLNKATLIDTMRQVVREEFPQVLQQNPVLQSIEQEKTATQKKVFAEFEKEHPDIVTNVSLQQDLNVNFGALVTAKKQQGLPVDFTETLYKAWQMTTGESTNEDIEKMVQKESASLSHPGASSKKVSGTLSLTDTERDIAKKLGLTEEQYLEGKKQSEEAKKLK